MKILTYTAIVFLAAALVAFMIMVNRTGVATPEDISTPIPTEEARELCYIWNTEAGDSATLRMSFTGEGGSRVTGSFNFRPAEKDSKTGPLEGMAGPLDQMSMARQAKLWWNASAEGTTVTEELWVLFGEGTAAVGFGEMRDRGDGTYVYADPRTLSYAPNLSQTDCDDEAVR